MQKKLRSTVLLATAFLTAATAGAAQFRQLSGFTAAGKTQIVPEPRQASFCGGKCILPGKMTVSVPDGAGFEFTQLSAALKRFAGVAAVKTNENAFCKLEISSDGTPDHDQGYKLAVTPSGIRISGRTATGVFYGIQTLKFILRSNPGRTIPCCEITDEPVIRRRGVFLNFRYLDRSLIPAAKRYIQAMAELKLNTMVLEFGDNFPLSDSPFTKRKFTLTKEELADLRDFIRQHHMEIIPHLQCWSHVAWFENIPDYRSLLEDSKRKGWGITYCPHNEKAVDITVRTIRESIDFFKPEYFHLCLDELEWGDVGKCEQCRKFKKHELVTKHTLFLQDEVLKKGVKPIVYHDTYYPGRSLKGEFTLDKMDKSTGIMVWNYAMLVNKAPFNYFDDRGFGVWGASWGQSPDNPRTVARILSGLNHQGSILTYWSQHVSYYKFFEKGISNRAFIGTVMQANYTWNPDAAPWESLDYDPVFLARLLKDPGYSPIQKKDKSVTIPIHSSFNHRIGSDSRFPRIKDAGELKAILASAPEKYDLVTAEKGGFYGIVLGADKKSGPRVVTIPVKPFKTRRLSYLLMTGRSNRESFYRTSDGVRHYPNIGMVQVTYSDNKKQGLYLFYNYNIVNWNSTIGGNRMRIITTGADDNGAVFSLSSLTHDINPDKEIKAISFYSNCREGVHPVLLAVSAVDPRGVDDSTVSGTDTGKIAARIAARPLPSPRQEKLIRINFNDFSAGMKTTRAYGNGFAAGVTHCIEKLEDGRTVLKIDVPPKKNMSSLARICIDLPITKEEAKHLNAVEFDFKVDNAFGVQRTDCYVTDKECTKWRVKHTFGTTGSEEWQHVNIPINMMETRNGGVTRDEYELMRISFWMHNDKPVTIRVGNIGGSNATRADAPLHMLNK